MSIESDSSCSPTGTRWAHENVRSVGRKETGRFTLMLPRISNELIAEARKNTCSVIAFEDLTGIRERTWASWGHKWTFQRLYEYVEYKAEEYGIVLEQVDLENTSRRCSHCGFTHPDNRDSENFECLKCEYENHADYNAVAGCHSAGNQKSEISGDGEKHWAAVSPS